MLIEGVRGDERVVGSAIEVAERIGAKASSVRNSIRKRYKLFGWSVRRVGSMQTRTVYAAYHESDTAREDPVIGDAEEVAEVIGISSVTYIYALANMNRVTKHGYYVETYQKPRG